MSVYGDVFAALNSSGSRFVVVGGVAVVLHGHARLTVDLDVVVDLAVEPARAAVTALTGLGLLPRLPVDPADFADPDIRTGWVEHRHLVVFSLYDPEDVRREVDIFASYPIPFEELVEQATTMTVDGQAVRVASIGHLIELKRAAGRPHDLEDIAALETIVKEATDDE